MFSQVLQNVADANENAPVAITGQINASSRSLGANNPVQVEAQAAVASKAAEAGRLRKSELLDIWKDDSISFAARCLVTLWWGHPSHFHFSEVYSKSNIAVLSSPKVENEFRALSEQKDFAIFKTDLESLYSKFRNGEYALNEISVSFFTKFFHFWFASHPVKSNPGYLPVIADDIMRCAVFAEMMDRGENVEEVFYTRDASLRSYVAFADKFNAYAQESGISAFDLEDRLFNESRGLGSLYVSAYNHRLCLPPWIAGRYNEAESVAIIFNNIKGESCLFEDASAQLIGALLQYDYLQPFDIAALSRILDCPSECFMPFLKQLKDEYIIVDHKFNTKEINNLRERCVKSKRKFLRKSKGTQNLQSIFELVDIDYRDRIEKQNIPSNVSFELTYGCNEMCIHCYNPNSSRETCAAKKIGTDEMVLEDYIRVLDDLAEMGVPKVLFTGGDPFVKKDFIKILQHAHSQKFAISIYTNGQSLYNKPELYTQVLDCYPHTMGLSLYSMDDETHEKITRIKGSCAKTKAIAEKLSAAGVGLLVKCPIMRINKDSYRAIYDYAISINAVPEFEVNITSSVDGDEYAVNKLRLTEGEMKELLKDPLIPLSVERPNMTRAMERAADMQFCGAGIDSVNIQPDGTVAPCIAFTMPCGSVKKDSIKKIWQESSELKFVQSLKYADSDRCGKESYCKYCNRCIGQSYTEKGRPADYSTDNCFIAKIRERLMEEKG